MRLRFHVRFQKSLSVSLRNLPPAYEHILLLYIPKRKIDLKLLQEHPDWLWLLLLLENMYSFELVSASDHRLILHHIALLPYSLTPLFQKRKELLFPPLICY